MQEAKPVVLTKPERGREMLTNKGPGDRSGLNEIENIDNKQGETFYEGYVDGQLFLVPDSNLEAMKDMINFRMRPKTSVRYKHQTSYDIQYYDQFTEKLNELLAKIDDFQNSDDLERPTSITQESSQNIIAGKSEELGKGKNKLSSKKGNKNSTTSSENENSKLKRVKSELIGVLEKSIRFEKSISSHSSDSSDFTPPEKDSAQQSDDTDEPRFRLLISGHFKDGEKPMYIVQEYDETNDVFKDQKLDFISSQENSNANVFISGKLYSENILVESGGKPLYLNTKPNKIIIDEEKSKTFNESFDHVLEKEDCCILLKGNFIKGTNGEMTPSLSLCVQEKTPSYYEGDR